MTARHRNHHPRNDAARAPDPLRGRGLRFVLVDELRQRPSMTVAEMVTVITGYGFELTGRASKVISDALRWEVARGRVVRLRRGVYRYGQPPRTTAWRISLFATRARTWIVAAMRGETPPPTPPERRRRPPFAPRLDPTDPPWVHFGWLWTS